MSRWPLLTLEHVQADGEPQRIGEGETHASSSSDAVMASRPSLVTPSGRFEMQCSGSFPLAKIPRIDFPETPSFNKKVSTANGARYWQSTWTCAQIQITLFPTSTEGLSIPPALSFTKDQTQVIIVIDIAAKSK